MKPQIRVILVTITLILTLKCATYNPIAPQISATPDVSEKKDETSQVPLVICDFVSGFWRTYETRQGHRNQMCGDSPCGYAGPIELKCEQGKVTGRALLGVDSQAGTSDYADISSSWVKNKLVLQYTDSQKCLITYTVNVEGEKLVGDYSSQHCIHKGDEKGDFLATKFPSSSPPHKSSEQVKTPSFPPSPH